MPPTVEEKLEKYLKLTQRALDKVSLKDPDNAKAKEILDLSKRYYADAHHFQEQDDKVNALIAVCYAHAFLDIGAISDLFEVDGDNELFMVDPNE